MFVASWTVWPTTSWAVDSAVIQAEQARTEVIHRISPAVVAIFGPEGGGGGSGVLISADGYALSNFHVTSATGDFMKCGLNDGHVYDAVIVGIDPTGDVALIKLQGRNDFPTAKIGNSHKLRVGQWVYVVGNPFLLATDFQPTVTYGIVSGVHRYQYPAGTFLEYTDCIQVDASINPGNSGGPLFNSEGELVGINGRASFMKRGRVNSGAGYAISINQVMNFLDYLRSGRVVDHGTIGATVSSDATGNVAVDRILESSQAYRRGLRTGDEIVSFASRPIRSVNQFKNILGIYPRGWSLPLVYRRDQNKHKIVVTLTGLHSESELMKFTQKPMGHPPIPHEPHEEKKPIEEPPPVKAQPELTPREQELRKLVEKRTGYANWYFNKLEQQRVLAALEPMAGLTRLSGRWLLQGTTADEKPFRIALTDDGLGLELAGEPYFHALDGQTVLDEPPQTGGLLLALHHLRLFLTRRDESFPEFYYLGSLPLDGTGERVDALVTELTGVEARWYFSRQQRTFVGFDLQLPADVDPCEIRFDDLAETDDILFPRRLTVRHQGKEYATFLLKNVTWELPAAAEPAMD